MRILCFGDSNTYGYDPRDLFGGRYAAGDRWVDLLARKTGWEVINAGSNGREIPRSPCSLPDHDVMLVMLGTNDLLQGLSAAEAAARMERFLTRMGPDCGSVFLIAPPPMKRGAWVPTEELVRESICLAKAYGALAESLGIPCVDTSDWNISFAFDGVHFTEAGHHIFAEKISAFLRKHLDSPPA